MLIALVMMNTYDLLQNIKDRPDVTDKC